MLETGQRRAFEALGIGPVWIRRQAPARIDAIVKDAPDDRPRSDGATAVDAPAAPSNHELAAQWLALAERVEGCRACPLGHSRQHAVMGAGSPAARWMLIGEAPGAEEDRQGEPFVGRAGALLDSMLLAAGLDRRRDVYIANVLKCRPPANRNPEPIEVARCEPHLQQQIRLLRPDLLVLMGRFAAQTLLGTDASIANLRGRVHQAEVAGLKIPAIVSYHPAYLLRNPVDKRLAWADWCLARRTLNAEPRQSAPPNQASAGSLDADGSPAPS